MRIRSYRFALVVCLLALMVVATAAASHSDRAEATARPALAESTATTLYPITGLTSASYFAELTTTDPTAVAGLPAAALKLDYDPDAEVIRYELQVTAPLADPTTAAICQGSSGQSGRTVFALFSGPAVDGDFSGVLAEGVIVQDDLIGPLENDTLADLMEMLRSGRAYATIGTKQCPIDAARGQIE